MSSGGTGCPGCGSAFEAGSRFCVRCGTTLDSGSVLPSSDPLVGRRIGTGFTIKELIGVGGMGRVYRAEQDALGRTVAVKVIHTHLLDDERTVARFYREARAASRLNHPNSVCVIDFGRTEDEVLYLVMEHVQGQDLSEVLALQGMLPLRRVCGIVEQVLEALIEAHALGVVHRDLKPENILVSPLRGGGDLVKVCDFGLATVADKGEPSERLTLSGSICGTVEYMSPEQIRGAPVDPRADLYAMGIILYELLTGSPPFASTESPAKIVFRHLSERVVDPAEVAPLRNIPEELSRITLRALEKEAADRWQDAEAMLDAVRAVSSGLGARTVECRTCGTHSPSRTRFCGGCGERLPRRTTVEAAPRSAPRLTAYPAPTDADDAMVGREDELQQLLDALSEAPRRSGWAHVSGDAGIGKTRLLSELGRHAADQGDLVIGGGAHASRAPVAYAPVRYLVSRLLDVRDAELPAVACSPDALDDPLACAGLRELVEPRGVEGFEDRSRIGAVAAAVECALGRALARSRSGRLVVLLDDLDYFDGLTRRVLARLQLDAHPGVLLVTAGRGEATPNERAVGLPLGGLDPRSVTVLLPQASLEWAASHPRLSPLYLAQLRALAAVDLAAAPPRVADAISQRLQRLEVEPTRVLQAVAILGDRCPAEWLPEMVGAFEPDVLRGLVAERLVRSSGTHVEIAHPFLRDVVLGAIPSEARHGLHVRALRLAIDHGAPLEVRAEHAFGSGEGMGAMVVLEQMGEVALRRGDSDAATLAFRRALEVARREMLESGDLLLEGAIATFSRKLGLALERAGDPAGAEGALREALDLTPPESLDRARMLLGLGRVSAARGHVRQGERLLRQAVAIAAQRGEAALEAEVYEALARVRRSSSDIPAAVEHMRRACELYGRQPKSSRRRLRSLVVLGEILVELGERHEAEQLRHEVRRLAEEERSPAAEALALACLARGEVIEGRLDRAEALYRDASRLAAEAGDADWCDQWARAATAAA